jgi:hypothetical protein
MNDPHVVTLRYRLVPASSVDYESPPPVERTLERFDFRLADGVTVATMRGHFASEQDAREAVEPYLRAYELKAALIAGLTGLRFEFDRVDIIDRRPPLPGEPQVVEATAAVACFASCAAMAHVTSRRYPEPPDGFRVSPDVQSLFDRYSGYRAGRELLTSMAYFCLTFVEKVVFAKREEAAKALGISSAVLRELGHLANVGDWRTARKASIAERRQHEPREVAWVEEAVRLLIQRMAEYAFDPAACREPLTMANLPPLT